MKIIRFSKAFLPCSLISALIIASGFVAIGTRGLNYGLDFKPGLMTEVRVAPTALEVGYTGLARAVIETAGNSVIVTVSGAGAENTSRSFSFDEYDTVDALASALRTVPNVTAAVLNNAGSTKSAALFVDSSVSSVLGSVPYRYHFSGDTALAGAETVRSALSVLDAEVQQIGAENENSFRIRVSIAGAKKSGAASSGASDTASGDEAADTAELSAESTDTAAVDTKAPDAASGLAEQVGSLLKAQFGADKVATISADFVGAQFSKSLAFKSIWVVLATLVLIWVYSTIRFKWDFALGAVFAIVHDALIMLAFIAWTGTEFTTTILAAMLTIIGYSINDTIVVLDRVRENQRSLSAGTPITDILDTAQTEILSRTIITTCTTLLAVIALYIFTSGSMKDFAQCLIVGMISGVYSTIYITGAFIAAVRRKR